MINLTPFLLFEGNCAAAMAFYHSCFKGELTITKVADTPDEEPNAARTPSQSCSRPPEKRSNRVFGHRLAPSHSNTEAGQYRRHVH